MNDPDSAPLVDRAEKKHSKKTGHFKSDKLDHSRKTALKRRLEEVADDDEDDWKEYVR